MPQPIGRSFGIEVNTGSPLSPPLFRYMEDGKEVKKEGSTMCTPFKGPVRFFVSLSKIYKSVQTRFGFSLMNVLSNHL